MKYSGGEKQVIKKIRGSKEESQAWSLFSTWWKSHAKRKAMQISIVFFFTWLFSQLTSGNDSYLFTKAFFASREFFRQVEIRLEYNLHLFSHTPVSGEKASVLNV